MKSCSRRSAYLYSVNIDSLNLINRQAVTQPIEPTEAMESTVMANTITENNQSKVELNMETINKIACKSLLGVKKRSI